MKRVLLTGATGFIGRHCLPFLKDKGYEVFALSSEQKVSSSDVTWLQCDLLNPVTLRDCISFAKPTHLLHLAWDVTPGKVWTSLDNLAWVKASLILLEQFTSQGGSRVVMAGTCAEYDWSASEFSERTTPCKPASLYGSCKLALQIILESFARQMGLSQAWGRIFYLYGPHENAHRFIPSIIGGLLKNEPIPCTECTQIRDFMHVTDVAEAFVALLDSDVQGVVNIGSGRGVALKEMIEIITDSLGKTALIQLGALSSMPDDPAHLIAQTDRLNHELNWNPKYTLEEGLNQVIKWWQNDLGVHK